MHLAVGRLVAGCLVVVTALPVTACGSGSHQGHLTVAPLAQVTAEKDAATGPNGIQDLSPPKALERAIAAMQAAGSYRVSGITVDGDAIDIRFKVGVGSVGTIKAGNPVQLIAANGVIYVTGNAQSLAAQVGANVDATIAGKWMLIPRDSSFAIFADGSTFATAVLGAEAPVEVTDITDVDGVPAVGLVFPDTEATLWVAAQGDPLPLRFEEKGASAGTGVLTFTDFGADVKVVPPPPQAVVDVSKLPPS